MSKLHSAAKVGVLLSLVIGTRAMAADSAETYAALNGLDGVALLDHAGLGKAALDQNLKITGEIQSGAAKQPLLLAFSDQQQQALRDAFITSGNGYGLSDGLGSALGGAYRSLTSYKSSNDGATSSFTSVSGAVARVFAFAYATTGADANAGKFFFSNETTNGKTPVPAKAADVLKQADGVADVYGVAYGRTPASAGSDPFGDPRPFQTEPHLTVFKGTDFFGAHASNVDYLRGPVQNLTKSPSYPSGHTTYGYTEALVFATLVPARYQQMIARGAEYGDDRIIMGAHYTMDVLAGRTLAEYDFAHMLANAPGYVGEKRGGAEIDSFSEALSAAKADLADALAKACGGKIESCAKQDKSRFANPSADEALYEATQTYGLPTVYPKEAAQKEDVGTLAPEAGLLLTKAFPKLTLARADAILTATEGPGGGFLDDGSAFGVYSRLDLFKAAGQAAQASDTN
jgi:membrane-associated phospholipid phosphatase